MLQLKQTFKLTNLITYNHKVLHQLLFKKSDTKESTSDSDLLLDNLAHIFIINKTEKTNELVDHKFFFLSIFLNFLLSCREN